jgi:hypothetical protein
MGWSGHPIFGQGVVGAIPTADLDHPHGQGWSGHPQKVKKMKNRFWTFGGGWTTPKGMGVASANPYDQYGGGPRPLGVVRQPPKAQNPFSFLFFFWAKGVVWPPLDWPWGWLQPPLGQKWGGQTTPFLAKGMAGATPNFLIFLFF